MPVPKHDNILTTISGKPHQQTTLTSAVVLCANMVGTCWGASRINYLLKVLEFGDSIVFKIWVWDREVQN